MAFQNDTGVADAHRTDDQQKFGSGASTAPGGANAPTQTQGEMTQGQEAYPGGRAGGETDKAQGAVQTGNETGLNADTPAAADVDPSSTQSSEETGQDGDPKSPGKNTGNPWNG